MKKTMFLIMLGFLSANTLSLSDNGGGSWEVNYTSNDPIGGFQFNVENAIVDDAYGGDATTNGFMISSSSEMVSALF